MAVQLKLSDVEAQRGQTYLISVFRSHITSARNNTTDTHNKQLYLQKPSALST